MTSNNLKTDDEEHLEFGSSQVLQCGQTIEFDLIGGDRQSTVLTVLKPLNIDESIKESGSSCHDVGSMEGSNLNNWVKYLVENDYVNISTKESSDGS